MDAIVTAGGIPQPEDPLYTFSNGNAKALIDVAGKPMVQWVLDALGDIDQCLGIPVGKCVKRVFGLWNSTCCHDCIHRFSSPHPLSLSLRSTPKGSRERGWGES